MKNRKKLSFFMMVSFLLMTTPLSVLAETSDYIREVPFTAENEQDGIPEFEQNIEKDGVIYTLSDVEVETVEKIPVEEIKYFFKEVETIVPEGENFILEEEITEDGIAYKCTNVQQEQVSGLGTIEQIVSGYTDYTYPVSESDIPQTKKVSAVIKKTGRTEEVSCDLVNVSSIGGGWQPNTIDITFYNADADLYEWNGIMVPGKQEVPLKGYEKEILQSVGADVANSRVNRTYWLTEPYTNEQGKVCRDARADIEEFVNYYRANYEKKLQSEGEGTCYIASYEGSKIVKSDTDFKYKRVAKASYRKVDKEKTIQKYVLAGIGILILIFLIISVLYVLAKRRRKKERNKK